MSIQIAPELLAEFERGPIRAGAHNPASGERCAMEWVAYLAGEPHSYRPACVSPTIRQFMVAWNDVLPTDEDRARLLRDLIPATLGTAGADERALSRMVWGWMVREWLPAWLDLVPALKEHAAALRQDGEKALPAARDAAAAAWDAAGAAAWAAARDAAWDAAWDAARAAAGDAARDAAWDAAGDAVHAALQPTVERLQASARELVLRLCAAAKGAAE